MSIQYLVQITDKIRILDYEIIKNRSHMHTFTFMILSDGREVVTFCHDDQLKIWFYSKPKFLELYRGHMGHMDFMFDPCHYIYSINNSNDDTDLLSFGNGNEDYYFKIVSFIEKCL